ncbi:uncharacterized protein BDR25DRAFT_108393 [Lindgomyces ingoldianus]|uniref:Uncharacterized protein n=1 Tax=Lindgomyces ingoldianus TaxID=673940 RepID=A0ACB6QBC7_9PLEO|nr:uncharacterized protein BDR25DRAFT_108393 [Lindgomyces ingoldianus]KAF2463445.1 hypothetical protein BDR25DRAFT_108393 [Lindgomyces ingoldianus]
MCTALALFNKMPTIPLHLTKPTSTSHPPENPLPPLLHTPTGLAILELQGTIHFPMPIPESSASSSTQVGKLVFPLYKSDALDPNDLKWMKRVYFYIGKNQRLTGEVRKLGKPFAVIKKREKRENGKDKVGDDVEMGGAEEGIQEDGIQEELEIVQVVRYKIVFSTRPEPVGGEEV